PGGGARAVVHHAVVEADVLPSRCVVGERVAVACRGGAVHAGVRSALVMGARRRLPGRVVEAGLARLRDRGLVAVRVPGRSGIRGAVAVRLVSVERVELAGVARVVFAAPEKLVDGLAEAAAAALVVLVLGGHRVRSSVVWAVVFWWDSPCSRASISAR